MARGARDPAVAAARALKEQELLLITMGLGAADMALLRELATSPDHCYRADQIDELIELYGRIGRMMAGKFANHVEIDERFNTEGSWGLRAWGELEPTQRVMREGRFSWLLATVQEEPTQLSYFLEALCPGWHHVAPGPAVFSAQFPDNRKHDAKSNRGPRILILPRVPGWQYLWLILNPLFFTLFRRWFCRRQASPLRKSPVRSKLEPLKLPPLIPVSSPLMKGRLPLRPSLIIGLGYGGSHALVHCKRLLWERNESTEFERLRFLALDTTSETFFPRPVAGLVTLDLHERLYLNQPLERIITGEVESNPPRYPWLPAHLLAAGAARPDLWRGSGHQRVLGRLALVSNRSTLEVPLQTVLRELSTLAGPTGIDILITGTSGGGTSSGVLLDLCWLLRCLLEDLRFGNASISLFLMTPFGKEPVRQDERQEKLQTHLRLANSQALLRELDRVAWLRSEPLAPLSDARPTRRWFDRVFYIGPPAREEWRSDTVLYPKGGEALFCWLASEGFCNHFKSLDTDNNSLTQRYSRCFINRIDPNSYFLYPRTVMRYLAINTLRRKLSERLWGVKEGETSTYSWRDNKPASISSLQKKWLKLTDWEGDFPWIFMSLDTLQDQDSLQQTLLIGAGPGISADISPLERSEYLQEQRELVRAALDTWVINTLNSGLSGVCESHPLSAVIHVLRNINEILIEGVALARHLETHSQALLVRDEGGLAAELASQAAAEVGAYVTHLIHWDAVLGEGAHADALGLIKYLDRGTSELQEELGRLMRETFPRLPLTWESLETLRTQSCDAVTESILGERTKWWVQRDGVKLTLEFHFKGENLQVWTLDNLVDPGRVAEFSECLIKAVGDLVPDYRGWRLQDYTEGTLTEMRAASPRTDDLNPGAQGLYLKQGDLGFQLTSHVHISELARVDDQESRVIGCEQNLSTELLWRPHELGSALPFIFDEEFHAYRAYNAYCIDQGLVTDRLQPALVGLCRVPNALLAFALVGLAGNTIVSRRYEGRQFWVANLNGERDELAEYAEDALVNFMNVAKAWISRDEPEFSSLDKAVITSFSTMVKQIRDHRLAEPIEQMNFFAQFVGVIWGLLLSQGMTTIANSQPAYQSMD